MPSREEADDALMEALCGGSARAFQRLYDRHSGGLFTFLARLLSDRGQAEELLQETFLRVYLQRARYRPRGTFRTWLYTIARNLALDRLRRHGLGEAEPAPGSLEAIPDPDPGPLRRLEGREALGRLEEALAKLPPGQREVLLLARYAGLGHAEIAEVTGSSPGAVRVALHRALRALRQLLSRP